MVKIDSKVETPEMIREKDIYGKIIHVTTAKIDRNISKILKYSSKNFSNLLWESPNIVTKKNETTKILATENRKDST